MVVFGRLWCAGKRFVELVSAWLGLYHLPKVRPFQGDINVPLNYSKGMGGILNILQLKGVPVFVCFGETAYTFDCGSLGILRRYFGGLYAVLERRLRMYDHSVFHGVRLDE